MGTKSKQRRRQKAARHRAEQARRASRQRDTESRLGGQATSTVTAQQVCDALWSVTGVRPSAAPSRDFRLLMTADLDVLALVAEEQLAWLIAQLWRRGWQPSEAARHARRSRDAAVGRIITAAIAADHERRDPATLHPQWAAQVDTLGLEAPGPDWLLYELRAVLPGSSPVLVVIGAMEVCVNAGVLPTIVPPPGADPVSWDRDDVDAAVDDPVLAKVRALLAQAESTTFEAEAEAFTAKAQELIARHAIDSALVWSRTDRKSRPTTIRLPIDDPYADQKSLLLQVVAEHSQCRAVLHTPYRLQSVVGFAADVAAAELLFTSLLVQSQTAMQAEAANAPPGSRVRGRSFRSSFLHAYAIRIGQRLAEVNRTVQAQSDADLAAEAPGDAAGSSLLPVLAARRDAVDAEIDTTFGKVVSSPVRGGTDALGYARGGLAADRAELNPSVVRGRGSLYPSRTETSGCHTSVEKHAG